MLKNKVLILLTSLLLMLTDTAYCEDDAGAPLAGETIFLNSSGIPNRKISVDPANQNEGFSAVMYDNSKGLPTSEANAITETDEGFIWIGSYGGLVRYDGNTFERMSSTSGIASVKTLYVASDGGLWVGTGDSGIFLLDRETITHWNKSNGLKSSSVIAIAEDYNKIIYIATTAGIAMIDSELNLTHVEDERIYDTYIRDIRLGNDGLIYGVTQMGDLFTLKDGKILTFLSYDDSQIKGIISLLPDPKHPKKIFVGTENSKVYYGSIENNFADIKIQDIEPLSYIERFEYIDNKIWICAGNGIGYIDKENFYKIENIPMENSIGHVMTDYEGNLWFTSTRHGVMKIVPNHFLNLYERLDLTPDVVNATCLKDEKLFIATDSGLTVLENGKKIESLPLKKAETASGINLDTKDLIDFLKGVRIRSIIRDSKGLLWISSWRKYGLLRYDHDKGELIIFNTDDGLFSERVRVVHELENGLILAANTGGINVIDGDKIIASYGEESGIVNTEILTVTEGFNHDYILGADGGGIYVLSKDGSTKHISTEEGLMSDIVMRVKRAKNKKIYWIVTSNSIAFMDENYKVTTMKNFPYSNNYDIYENSSGSAWILASNGVYVIPVDELIKNNENIEPRHYNIYNGLPCIPTSNSYSELTDEGEIYISCLTGVVKSNVDKPFKKRSDLKISVPYLEVDGKKIYPDENGGFTVPSNAHKVTVNSFVYNYSLVNPMVSWQLEGFENENVPISRSDLAPVVYTNLRGGVYNFTLQLMDFMKKRYKKVSVQIIKERAFYEEIWFYIILCWLLFVTLNESVSFYIRRKTLKLEERNHENMTFIKEITEAFAKVIDIKDSYTNGHSTRVANYTTMLAKELGYNDDQVEKFYRIALLHDIGKIGVPAEVLNKSGKLTDEEFEIIKSHTTKGYEVLKEISIMPDLAAGAQSHHERPDGKGYPNGLKGNEIPRAAQIIAVADCFDAMYSNRPYRKRMNFDKAVSIIREVSGTQLTSDVVDAFLRLVARGKFRAPDDDGGGSFENIENIKAK